MQVFKGVVDALDVVNPSSGPNELFRLKGTSAIIYTHHRRDPLFSSYDVSDTLGEIFSAVRVVR